MLEAIYAAYGTGWDDVAGTDPRAQRPGRGSDWLARDARRVSCRTQPRRGACWRCCVYCESRAAARRDGDGDYVPLAEQDTALWDRELLGVAERALRRGRRARRARPFQLEAAIQSAHTQRRLGAAFPHAAIVALYDALVALPADGRRDRQPRLRRRRGAAAPLPGAPRSRRSPRGDVESYQPYWAALAHLAAAGGTRDRARRRASARSA